MDRRYTQPTVSSLGPWLWVLASVVFTPVAAGQELPEYFLPVRPLGMGNAFTGVANDHNSVWSNPAGIARIRKARSRRNLHLLTFPNVVAGANTEGRKFYNDVQSSQGRNPGTGFADNLVTVAETVDATDQKPLWVRAGINPLAFFEGGKNRPIAFGLYSNSKMKLTIDGADPSAALAESTSDVGALLGLGFSNRTNRFNLGVQARYFNRYGFEDKIALALLADRTALQKKIQSDSNTGSVIAVDAGFLWTFADFWFPTIGAAVLNAPTGCRENYLNPYTEQRQTICGATMTGSINNPESLSLIDPTDLRVGVSLTPRLTRKVALRFAADLHHLYATDGSNFYGLPGIEPIKQVHAGVELFIGNPLLINPLSFRLGYNQGFTTVGASIRVGIIAVDVASYGQDVSAGAKQREDRRTVVAISTEY